jgi:catechol 2,3-dioxygenase-like lactoylglutathione lyase family enzyme
MESVISHLLAQFDEGKLTRRQLIQALAAVALVGTGEDVVAAQAAGFRTRNLDHLSYDVTDYRRTRDFYAGLMGMAVANDNGMNSCELHFGDATGVGVRDRTMMSIRTAATARVDHLAFRIDNWDTDRVRAELERRGLQAQLARGGALDTPNYVSLTVQDPDGLGVQISGIARPGDAAYKQP